MELTRAVLNELLKSLRSNAKSGSEKRLQPRVGLRLRARAFTSATIHRPVDVWLRDVSGGGMGVMSPQSFAHGETINIILADAEHDQLPCTVVYCRRVGAKLFQIGLKFAAGQGSIAAPAA